MVAADPVLLYPRRIELKYVNRVGPYKSYGAILKRRTFLGAISILAGVLSFWIIKFIFPYLGGFKVLLILFPISLIILLIYFFMKKLDYLYHEYLFSINIAQYLLAVIDVLNIGRHQNQVALLFVISRIASERSI